jgi:hypothetical protein
VPFTVKVAVRVTPPLLAEMTALRFVEPAIVLMVKFELVAPAGTVTLAGTVAADVLSLASEMVRPPAGAALLSVTVPVDETPPVTVAGFSESADRLTVGGEAAGGVIVSCASREELLVPAVMLTVRLAPLIGLVLMLKVALVLPAGTVTLSGTLASELSMLKILTTTPPAGAALLSVT